MSRYTPEARDADNSQTFGELVRLDDRQLKDGAHRTTHRSAQKRAARCLTYQQSLNTEPSAISHDQPQVFGAGKAVHRSQEPRLWACGEDVFQRWHWRDSADGQKPLIHRETGERFEQFLFRDENIELLGTSEQQRLELVQPSFRKQQGNHLEPAFEQPAHDLLAFGDEDALL